MRSSTAFLLKLIVGQAFCVPGCAQKPWSAGRESQSREALLSQPTPAISCINATEAQLYALQGAAWQQAAYGHCAQSGDVGRASLQLSTVRWAGSTPTFRR